MLESRGHIRVFVARIGLFHSATRGVPTLRNNALQSARESDARSGVTRQERGNLDWGSISWQIEHAGLVARRLVPAHRFPAIHFFLPLPLSPAFLLNGNGELRLRFMAALYLGGCEISVLWPTGLSRRTAMDCEVHRRCRRTE